MNLDPEYLAYKLKPEPAFAQPTSNKSGVVPDLFDDDLPKPLTPILESPVIIQPDLNVI